MRKNLQSINRHLRKGSVKAATETSFSKTQRGVPGCSCSTFVVETLQSYMLKSSLLETLKYCLQKVTPLHVFLKAIDNRSGYRLAIIIEDLSMTVSGF